MRAFPAAGMLITILQPIIVDVCGQLHGNVVSAGNLLQALLRFRLVFVEGNHHIERIARINGIRFARCQARDAQ